MKLTKISAKNFKGLSFELELADVNFLVGCNFAGKSARTDAIRLLLLGYLPELGKTNRATFGLSSGREMSVEGAFDNGKSIKRTWHLEGDSVKASVATDDREIFEDNDQLAVMLNAETYFALSDRERVNYVFANVPMDYREFHASGLFALIRNRVEVEKIETGKNGEVLDRVIGFLKEKVDEALSPQEQIEVLLEMSKLIAKTAKEYAARMEKTAQGLATLRAQDNVNGVDFAALDEKRTELSVEIAELHEQKGKLAAAGEQARANKRRREALSETMGQKQAATVRLHELVLRENELRTAIAGILNPTPDEIQSLRADERDNANAVSGLSVELRMIGTSIETNERDLAGVDSLEKCPYCGAAGEGWKALKRAEINSALSGLRVKRDQLNEHLAKVKAAGSELLQRLRDANNAASGRALAEKHFAIVNSDLARANDRVIAIERAEQELATIPAPDPEADNALRTIETSILAANAELGSLDKVRREALGRANDLKRLAEAEKGRDEAKLEQAIATTAAELLRDLQAKMVADAFKPLLARANNFFETILKTPLAYHDGEIGTWRGGVWVAHRTFSGTEKALCYAAIQAALAAKSPVKIMLLDELGRLDDVNVEAVVKAGMAAANIGWIDQFVGIAPRKIETKPSELLKISFQTVEIY